MRNPCARRLWCGILIAGVVWCVPVGAQSIAERARNVFEQHKASVVTIKLVVKEQFSMAGRASNDNEQKREITGTVIGPDGLTVIALSELDPSEMYRSLMASHGAEEDEFKLDSQVARVAILTEDGKEIEARVILRDSDLDLAFVRPTTAPADGAFAYVDLGKAVEPKLLDDLVAINRLGRVAQREHSASMERVEAIVTKPRMFYVPGQCGSGNATAGCPVFDLDGRIVGVAVLRTSVSTEEDVSGGMIVIILPAADVAEVAAQAVSGGGAKDAGPGSTE
ncbi:MAG TPA: serine protease [Candidatus Hydrogenedentes bacterium]|nr:serine protease [Candidatus Hydrogenedentota bacterium]HPG68454.1 serine protease [Candidatus Hydrogenedentota bacterium]